jgi:hypothetical protein
LRGREKRTGFFVCVLWTICEKPAAQNTFHRNGGKGFQDVENTGEKVENPAPRCIKSAGRL